MTTDDTLPRIDLQHLVMPGGVRRHALDDLAAAAERWGFFELHGHGVPPQHRARLFAASDAFFALPAERKDRVARSARNARGYNAAELTKNRTDTKEIFDFGHRPDPAALADAEVNRVADGWNQFPEGLPGFEDALWRWYGYCESLAAMLLAAIAEALGADTQTFESTYVADHSSFLRLNRYPAVAEPAPATAPDFPEAPLGIHHHTDAGLLTLLAQRGPAALQVRHRGRWTLAAPQEDTFVVNIGDMMQVLSNDRFVAPEHRVLASRAGAERSSAAFFFNPPYAATIAPLTPPARYRDFTWERFRAGRAAGDYADLGEEIQISQFRRPASERATDTIGDPTP